MQHPSRVILSCGRSGSGYIARILQESGVAAGHEAFYNISKNQVPVHVESSWMALPFVEKHSDATAFFQMRNPLHIVSSFDNGDLLLKKHKKYLDFMKKHVEWKDSESSTDFFTKFVCEWTKRCVDRASKFWKLEDLHPQLVADVFRLDIDRVEKAFEIVPNNYNHHGNKHVYTWEELDDNRYTKRLRTIAESFGYEQPGE